VSHAVNSIDPMAFVVMCLSDEVASGLCVFLELRFLQEAYKEIHV